LKNYAAIRKRIAKLSENAPQTGRRQQELLVLVDAAVGRAAPGRDPVRGSAAQVRRKRRRAAGRRRPVLFADRQGSRADRGRRNGMGLARDLRNRRRALSRQAALAR